MASHRLLRLTGERSDMEYLFDPSTGQAQSRTIPRGSGNPNAGIGRRCWRCFVAVHVDPCDGDMYVQVDERRMVLDGETDAVYEARLRGYFSRLTIMRPPDQPLVARQRVGVGAVVQRATDPAYDELDRLDDDFLDDVADIIGSPDRRRWILETKDAEAGSIEVITDNAR